MGKWLVGAVVILCERYPRPTEAGRVIQLAYERGRETNHVTVAMNNLVRVSADWPMQLKHVLFNGDIETAFDTLSLHLVEASLCWWNPRRHPCVPSWGERGAENTRVLGRS